MLSDNATFSAYNLAQSRKPRYTLVIDFSTAGTDLVYLTSHVAGEDAVAGGLTEGVDYFPACVRNISGTSQRIDPLNGSATIGNITFAVLDRNISSLLSSKIAAGKGTRRKRVQVYVGFEGMAFVDYELRHTYWIEDLEYHRGEYVFQTEDIQRQIRQRVFVRQKYHLRSSISATDTKLYVDTPDTTKFPTFTHDAAYSDAPSSTVGYIRLEDTKEVIRHVGMASDGGGNYIQVDTNGRGALGTTAVAHDVDAGVSDDRKTEVIEWIYIEGPAPLLAYNVLRGTTYPAHWTLGIASSLVTQSDFEAYPDLYDTSDVTAGRQMRFEGLSDVDGKEFLEREIMLWLGAFMPVYADGSVGFKKRARILAGGGYLAKFDESNVVSYGALKQMNSEVLNKLRIRWNYVASPKFRDDPYFSRETELEDTTSQSTNQESDWYDLEFRGVHTGANTDNDLRFSFDSLRDSFSGAPLRMPLETLPVGNVHEVGDTVRVALSTVQDPFTGGALDRVFEIQQVRTDWRTGCPRFDLFGSSAAPGALTRTAAATVISDAWYTSTGTDLASVLTISGGAVTADGTITGSATSTPAIFYYDGDLTVNAGVTVTLTGNWQLRIKGFFTINGALDGAENGHSGGAGQTTVADNSTNGTSGYWSTSAGGGVSSSFVARLGPRFVEVGLPNQVTGVNVLEFFETRWDGTNLAPLPQDLRGSSGGGGLAAVSTAPTSGVIAAGSDGGAGGSGGVVVSRGGGFGASGGINLSGGDAGAQNSGGGASGTLVYAGVGAPGMPGALTWYIDGNNSAPDLVNNVTALPGAATFNTSAQRIPLGGALRAIYTQGVRSYYEPTIAFDAAIHAAASTRVIYVVEAETVEAEIEPAVHQIATPSAPTLSTTPLEPKSAADAGAVKQQIKATIAVSTDPDFTGTQVQAKRNSEAASAWQPVSGAPEPTQTTFYFEGTQGVQYDVRARYLSARGEEGHSDWSSTASTTPSATSVTIGDPASGAATSIITVDTSGDVQVGAEAKVDATNAYKNDSIYWHWQSDTVDGLRSEGTSGSGFTASMSSFGYYELVANTTNSHGWIVQRRFQAAYGDTMSWTQARSFKARIEFIASASTWAGRNCWIGVGNELGGLNFFGFEIVDGELFAKSVDSSGTAETTSILTLGTDSQLDYEAVFTPSTDVKFYVGGTLQATHSTNLPSSTGSREVAMTFTFRNDASTSKTGSPSARLGEWRFSQRP